MKNEARIFLAGPILFFPVMVAYGVMTSWHEPLGVVGLILLGLMTLMIGFYIAVTGRKADFRPEDDPHGEIHQLAGEQGLFAPTSWWPLPLAAAGVLIFAGLAVGWWLVFMAAALGVVSLVGWVYEFYRGEHAH